MSLFNKLIGKKNATGNWVRKLLGPLVINFDQMSLCDVQLGSRFDSLYFLGPDAKPHEMSSYHEYFDLGIAVGQSDDGFYFEHITVNCTDDLNYTPEIENITIPALLLWGADDGIVPAELADYIYEHLGTDPSMKEVVKIPECSHGPQVEQPEIFYDEVSSFVETYKNQ